jgi:hypothetical protein
VGTVLRKPSACAGSRSDPGGAVMCVAVTPEHAHAHAKIIAGIARLLNVEESVCTEHVAWALMEIEAIRQSQPLNKNARKQVLKLRTKMKAALDALNGMPEHIRQAIEPLANPFIPPDQHVGRAIKLCMRQCDNELAAPDKPKARNSRVQTFAALLAIVLLRIYRPDLSASSTRTGYCNHLASLLFAGNTNHDLSKHLSKVLSAEPGRRLHQVPR